MRLRLASMVVTLVAVGATGGCGGRTDALLSGAAPPEQDSGGESNDGGPTEDVIVYVDAYVPPFDAPAPPEDAPVFVPDSSSCLDVGEECSGNDECCSFLCLAGVCQEVTPDEGGISCAAPTGNPCLECLAGSCCPDLAACENDSLCTQALDCFEACFTGNNGATCSSQCNAEFPSMLESALTGCGASQCASSCE
jgi:hypothetical protein